MFRLDTAFVFALILCVVLKLPSSSAGVLDVHLRRLLLSMKDENVSRSAQTSQHLPSDVKHKLTRTGFMILQDVAGEKPNNDENLRGSRSQTSEAITTVSVLMETSSKSTVEDLKLQGVQVRTVLPNGIITANVPISLLSSLSERHDVGRVEAAHSLRFSNDVANSLQVLEVEENNEPHEVYNGMNNTRTRSGKGVIVGVYDTGLDWTHQDFIDENGNSRILYYWDQNDVEHNQPIKGDGWLYAYGREYKQQDFNDALFSFNNTWDPESNYFAPATNERYPIKASARDTEGHGTHVTGTLAGNGRGSGKIGVAHESSIIFVKMDVVVSDASIVDGINYIFHRAAELNMSSVINLSLGYSYGPHDGNTLSDLAIDSLIGPGRIVVAAAGNDGYINGSNKTVPAFHANGNMLSYETITIQVPSFTAGVPKLCFSEATDIYEDNFVFFDLWYGGSDSCKVRVTSPSGAVYPTILNSTLTGKLPQEFDTEEGFIYISNGIDDDDSTDNRLFFEISDSRGTLPAIGTWKVELLPVDINEGGRFDAWFGASDSIIYGWYQQPYPRDPISLIGERQTDNKMTIDSPAAAKKVIAVGAYTSRTEYYYYDPWLDKPAYIASDESMSRLGELAYFSSRGPRRDNVTKPDITAPGFLVVSSFSHFVRHEEWLRRNSSVYDSCKSTNYFQDLEVSPDLESAILAGTSMASPNVAGAVALFLEVDPNLSETDVKRILAQSALHDYYTDTFELYSNTNDPAETDSDASTKPTNEDWGLGKIDIDAALAVIESQ